MKIIAGIIAVTLTVVIVCESRSLAPAAKDAENTKRNSGNSHDRSILTAEDFENAEKLTDKQKFQEDGGKGLENSNMFEGDIANPGLNSATIYRFVGQNNPNDKSGTMRAAIRSAFSRWPANTIPYDITSNFTTAERAIIADALSDMMNKTCFKFVGRTNQTHYVHIMKGKGCYSYVGRIGGKQDFSLGNRCVSRHIIQHEMMHAIGLFHEQSRADRDDHVEVLSDNIVEGMAYNFNKYKLSYIDHLGQPYDYYSIMHYQSNTFAKPGTESIRPVAAARAQGVKLVRRREMSAIDIKKLNTLAGCPDFGDTSG